MNDEASSACIIDVRCAGGYAAGNVAGAIDVPLGLLERWLASVPRDRAVAVYCNMRHHREWRGEHAAAQFTPHGIEAHTLDGGCPRWFAMPMRPGANQSCVPIVRAFP
jgi:rhodanese-related sulfurtransferase